MTSPSTSTPGETLGIVGESGSGKSVTALSILRLLPRAGPRSPSGTILFDGQRPAARCRRASMRAIRGGEIAMIFQDPMTSLNPVLTDRRPDRRDAARCISGLTRRAARERAIELLEQVRHPRRRRGGSTTIRTSCPAACGSG